MPVQIQKRVFAHTKYALAQFDLGKDARAAAWLSITTEEGVYDAQRADEEALRKVQDAFYLDTQDINTQDNCRQVDIAFMRRMAEG